MNEEFEKWAKGEGFDLTLGKHSGTYMNPETFVANAAWQASRKQALEEAATKAETEICDCCWPEDAKEAAEEIAFQIRAMQKE